MNVIKEHIINRVLDETNYIIETKQTIREVAREFNVSKSTVHKDLSERLKILNKALHEEIERLMQEHIEVRHIKGGESTKQKYLKLKR